MRRELQVTGLVLIAAVACKAKGGGDRYDNSVSTESRATADYEGVAASMGSGSAMPDPGGPATGGKDGTPTDKPTTWKRSQLVPNSSHVMVGDDEELALRGMQTHVTIDGFRARVVIDYLYANDRDSQYEGNFQLRLPEEASPYFFAFGESTYRANEPEARIADDTGELDAPRLMQQRKAAWKAPREARMVPREKAQIAYGATVRRRVDPAIVEWAGAGVFSARVFPLPPHSLNRIVVGYDVDLTPIGDDLEYRFDLPEQAPVSTIDVRWTGAGSATATPVAKLDKLDDGMMFHFDAPKERAISVHVAGAKSSLLVGTDQQQHAYFATRVKPVLATAASVGTTDSAVFLVDTSLSSNPDRFNVWLSLLRSVLAQNRDTIRHFNVLFFSVDAHWYKPAYLDNTPEAVDALIAYANGLALEGATDLGGALGEAAKPAWLAQADHHDLFLLSDGAATWGEGNLHALGHLLDGGGSLFAYQTGLAGTDVGTLVHLARDSGGAVFSVTGEAEVAPAAVAHRARPWRLVGVEVTGGSDVLVAGNPTALFPGQSLLVVGRGAIAKGAALKLTVEQDGKREVVTTPLAAPLESDLAPRAYGQVATAHLEELGVATEPQARAYATHFRVTGKTTSLLMLESEADYERFHIKPDDDAYVVQATPAATLFAMQLAAVIDTLGDPKATFLAMLKSLERSPDIHLEIPASYRTAIEQLPSSAFAVPAEPLATTMRTRTALPPSLVTQLASHKLDYDVLTAAAITRRQQGSAADALKALSSLVEESPGDAVLARDVGFSAMDLGLHAQAYHLFRRVAEARPHEPQTYRALAQALAAMGRIDLAIAFYEIPLMGHWDARFGELQKIVELDYLHFLRGVTGNANTPTSLKAYAESRVAALAKSVGIEQADLVVTITWNTDNTDVDLHVTEPSGEECFYSNRETRSGGQLTQDVTQGYGPEMYVLPRAPRGTYQVRAHYFASDANRASARSKVYATVYENWGTPEERVSEQVVTLEAGREMHAITTVKR